LLVGGGGCGGRVSGSAEMELGIELEGEPAKLQTLIEKQAAAASAVRAPASGYFYVWCKLGPSTSFGGRR
jgi:hypothetical protein